jgi:transketolase
LDFGYQNLSGNIISVGGAFDYSQLGCSHHCYTDVSLFCHLKRAVVVIPGSPLEFNILFKALYDGDGINYFRLPEVPHEFEFSPSDIRVGKGVRVREGHSVTIAVIGTQLKNALAAAERLAADSISAEILYFPTIKPFDAALLRASVEKTSHLLSVEELSAHDGLLNLCLRACIGLPEISADQIAIEDFIHGYGSYDELCARLHFSPEGIEKTVRDLLSGQSRLRH